MLPRSNQDLKYHVQEPPEIPWSDRWEEGYHEDLFSLQDRASEDQFKLWRNRGGRSTMLRLSVDPESVFVLHMAVRLVDASSGNSCVGINFEVCSVEYLDKTRALKSSKPAKGRKKQPGDCEKTNRCFMVVDDELSRTPEKLLTYLRRRKVVDLNIQSLKMLLKKAPTLIVMPEAAIDMAFW